MQSTSQCSPFECFRLTPNGVLCLLGGGSPQLNLIGFLCASIFFPAFLFLTQNEWYVSSVPPEAVIIAANSGGFFNDC